MQKKKTKRVSFTKISNNQKMSQDFMMHVEKARKNMEAGEYSLAHEEYHIADDIFKKDYEKITEFYKTQVLPSLELLRKRQELVDKVESVKEELREARKTYNAIKCGPEKGTARIEVDGLRGSLQHTLKKLDDFESILLVLWKEEIKEKTN